jgi:hypothetical protein
MFNSRDLRAAAQSMLWSPLHPQPDGAALSSADRRIVIGVYPFAVATGITIGSAVPRRKYVLFEGQAPSLLGQYIPAIDRKRDELWR